MRAGSPASIALAWFAWLAVPAHSAGEPAPLTLEATIPLPNVSGRIDHMAIDLGRKRLFVAERGNGSLDVVDLASRKVIHRIPGLKDPQGVAYVPQSDLIAVAGGGDGAVRIYDGRDFSRRGVVSLGDDADDMRVDPRNGHVIVGYGSGGLAVIDAYKNAKLADIHLPEHPEGFELSPSADRIFVNVPDARQIAVVDLGDKKVVATWQPPRLSSNFPLALDDASKMVAVVFRAPARLVLFDAVSGALKASADTCADADDVFFDPKRNRLYVSCGAGALDVFQRDTAGVHRLARVSTSWGARTSLFVPELDRLFVAARAGLFGSTASVRIYRPNF